MNYEIQRLTKEEKLYSSRASEDIEKASGFVGQITIFPHGKGFLSKTVDTKTDDFIGDAVNVFRKIGIFYNKLALMMFCKMNPENKISENYYGFRVNTEKYSFIFKISKTDRCYCYCYLRNKLDKHIESSKNGVDLTIHLSDGDCLVITDSYGTTKRKIRIIDNETIEIGILKMKKNDFINLAKEKGWEVDKAA